MDAKALRAAQAPLKERYRSDPGAARIPFRGVARLGEAVTVKVESRTGPITAGLHPSTGGDGSAVCAGDILLQALVACAGVTLAAVATALGITVRAGSVTAEAELDVRGTLGVSKDAAVGFQRIRLRFELDSDAAAEQLASLIKLTERYCVVYQTLRDAPEIETELVRSGGIATAAAGGR
jgi:uncharacterized OsmC-like protein